MNPDQQKQFEDEVIRMSNVLFHYDSQRKSFGSQGAKKKSKEWRNSSDKVIDPVEVIDRANKAVEENGLRQVICRSLGSVAHDLTTISKIVVAAMLPLSLSKTINVPVD